MAAPATTPWNLESFLDSLILELDKAQDTLAVKSLSRRMTYTLGEMSVDLNVFPVYQEGKVKFQLARPGESGSSKLSFQLGSITDRQIREMCNEPVSRDDIAIDGIDELDEEVKESLKKVGVKSARDLERLEKRNVAVDKVLADKTGGEKKIDYQQLANIINKARRRRLSPQLSLAQGRALPEAVLLTLKGQNFMLAGERDPRYPAALMNGEPVQIESAEFNEMRLLLPRERLRRGPNALSIALDPYAVVELTVTTAGTPT